MTNVWGAYNSLITLYWSRSAGLIYSGDSRDGLGYRDSMQDVMGAAQLVPEDVRAHLAFMISGQESNGGAMPELKPYAHYPGKMPLTPPKEQRSDDCIWFFTSIPTYVNETGDWEFYNEIIPYSDSDEDTVFMHMKRALQFTLDHTGIHGLPCGLHADWDDGFRLGFSGETVMLAFQVRLGWKVYAELAEKFGMPQEMEWAEKHLAELDANLQKHTWDGEWFIRAFREKGDMLGSHTCKAGMIFRPPQSWAVMSGAATPEQARIALDSVDKHLATEHGLMALAPPYYDADYNEIRAMVLNPGQKENAGIFSHSQSWTVMANCIMGDGDRAYRYYSAFLPAKYNDRAELRRVEPYVHCQSTDSPYSPNPGRSHLPWLSGTATWSYYCAVQYILGIRPENDGLRIDPCIPSDWPGFTATRTIRDSTIRIEVTNPKGICKGITSMTLNGEVIQGNVIPFDKLQSENTVICELG